MNEYCFALDLHLQKHGVHSEDLLCLPGGRVEGVHLADGRRKRCPTWSDASHIGRSSASPSVLPGDVARIADGQAEAHEGQAPGSS